jgi:hypothetical protein
VALVKCADCGKEISDQAPACPNCGRPNASSPIAQQTGTQCPKCGKMVTPIVTSVGGGSCTFGSRERWSCPACKKVIHRKGCFVATAVYGDEDYVEVQFLRAYRDTVLRRSLAGRMAISTYYRFGPYLGAVVERNPVLKRIGRLMLDRVVDHIERATPLKRERFREG